MNGAVTTFWGASRPRERVSDLPQAVEVVDVASEGRHLHDGYAGV